MKLDEILNNSKCSSVNLEKRVLVYVPCYNCAEKIERTIQEIPEEYHGQIECLLIDNHSTDSTKDVIEGLIKKNPYAFKIHFIRTEENLGYAGSQKLAYYFALQHKCVRHVIMLHGDGQYPSTLLRFLFPFIGQDYDLVNGYRTKREYPKEEETPWPRYLSIKFLSCIENLLLGIKQKEWYSGFVMYKTDFLRKIPLSGLSSTMHIDGEFLMCSDILNAKTHAVSIYKRYKAFEKFGSFAGIKVVINIFQLIFKYRSGYYHQIIREHADKTASPEYEPA